MQALTNIDKIKDYFPKHSRVNVKTFLAIVSCMLKLRTTCMYKCKDKMAEVTGKKKTQAMSHYKTIIRFFKIGSVKSFCEGIFMLVFFMFGIDSNRIVIDRTNWKIGKKNVNLLTAGVLFFNCFIPLCWQQLDKRGNSNFKDRRILMNRFIKLWRIVGKSIKGMVVIADREFIGHDWLMFLNQNRLDYVFRLKDNMYFELFGDQLKKTPIAQLRRLDRKKWNAFT